MKVSIWPAMASMFVLIVAAFSRWPYGFYVFMRFVVCGSTVYLAVGSHETKKNLWAWVMGGLAEPHVSRAEVDPRRNWLILFN